MNNNLVSPVVSNKCLGADLDHKLTFHTYIEEICKKICSGIGVLKRIRQFVPQGFLVTLYKSLIQPYFHYCSPLWDTCDKTLRNKLQILQNRAARIIIETRYDDRIRSSDLLQSFGWDTLHVRWAKLKSALLKILNENYSPCLGYTLVRLRNPNRRYNLRNHDMDLALPKPKTNFLKRSFKYNASMLWNNLPLDTKTSTSLPQFKQSITNCRFSHVDLNVTHNFIFLVIFLCTNPSCKPAYCWVGLACLLNKFDNNNNNNTFRLKIV